MADKHRTSHWDYRIMQGIDYYAIYSVFYNSKGEIEAFSNEPETFTGDTLEELHQDFMQAQRAFQRPVLNIQEVNKQMDEEEESDGEEA